MIISKRHSCEPNFSNKDSRLEIQVDEKLKVQLVLCEDKDSLSLGKIKIEKIQNGNDFFLRGDFEELEPPYEIEKLEEEILSFLENQ